VAESAARAWVHAASRERSVPWLATARAGDVLAGFIAGLMARGYMPHEVAGRNCMLNAAPGFGSGLIAQDLSEEVPGVFRKMLEQA